MAGPRSEVCVSAHVTPSMSLQLSKPVNCIFWPIRILNWLVAACKVHTNRMACCTTEYKSVVCIRKTLPKHKLANKMQ